MTEHHLSVRSTRCQVQRRRSTSATICLALRLKTTANNTNNNNNNNNARARKTSHDNFRCNYKVSWRAGKASSSFLASSASPLSRVQLVTIKCVIFVYAFDTFVFLSLLCLVFFFYRSSTAYSNAATLLFLQSLGNLSHRLINEP